MEIKARKDENNHVDMSGFIIVSDVTCSRTTVIIILVTFRVYGPVLLYAALVTGRLQPFLLPTSYNSVSYNGKCQSAEADFFGLGHN